MLGRGCDLRVDHFLIAETPSALAQFLTAEVALFVYRCDQYCELKSVSRLCNFA